MNNFLCARKRSGFTLVEMLVAITIFLVLIVMITQILTYVSTMAAQQNNRMSSVLDTRQALNRFAQDWYARARRPDVDWLVSNPGSAAASVTLLSQVAAVDGDRGLASVSYQIISPGTGLERGTLGYNWQNSGTNPTLLFTGNPAAIVPPVPPATDFEVLAPTVFRLAISYLDSTTGKWTVTPQVGLNARNLAAIAITMASIDGKSRAILSATQMLSLSTALGDVSGIQDPLAAWVNKLNASGFATTAGVPTRAAAAVNIDQRILSIIQ